MNGIEGMDELLAALDGPLREAALDGAAAGLERGLKRTVATAKLLAPVDRGELRNSITSYVGRKGGTADGVTIATSDHAVYVEMGTGDRGHASDNGKAPGVATYTAGWPGMAAQAYMYPAHEQTKGLVLADAAKGIAQRLREVF
jgi:hypothetical protein